MLVDSTDVTILIFNFQLSIKRITFVPLQFAGLSLVLRDGRNVRATESTILLNGKLSARVELRNRKRPPDLSGKGEKVR